LLAFPRALSSLSTHSSATHKLVKRVGEPVLVHDPVGLDPARRLAGVEDERLLDPERAAPQRDGLVGPGGLPVAVAGGAVGEHAEVEEGKMEVSVEEVTEDHHKR
jgi:hypothetical protein